MKNIEKIASYYRTLKFLHETQLSPLQKEFRNYFEDLMDKYNVSSPADLTDEKKSEFFNNLSKHWDTGKGAKEGWEEKVTISETKNKKRKLTNAEIQREKLAKESLRTNTLTESSMNKKDARLYLKNIGYTVEEIKKLER